MTTYTLSVSTSALGLGVIGGARVSMEKRRAIIANAYPPTDNLYRIELPTNSGGLCPFPLEPDDSSTFHTAKVFDTNGILVFQKQFSMPPQNSNLEDSAIGVVIGGSLIQFKSEGVNLGTPTSVRNLDFVGAGMSAELDGDKVTVTVDGYKSFVAITDIGPTSISDNVSNKVMTDDNNVLQSCTSSTTAITVSVLAVTGSTFKPVVNINGADATLTRNALTDVWQGSAAITLSGSSPYTVTATHSDGAIDTATVTIEAAPVVSSVLYSNAYSQGAGQTEHAAGQTLTLTVTSATPFVELEVIGDSTTATTASNTTFASTTSKALSVTVANQGNIATSYPAKVRIRNANGTWSAITASNASASVDGENVITLNNTQPSILFGSITYPASQSALKDGESATIAVTESNVSTIAYTSPNSDLSISSPTTTGAKTVTRIAGNYNVSTANLQAIVTRTANATSSTTTGVVLIGHTTPTIAITTPAARLRSGVTAQNHTITLTSSQRLIEAPSLTASVGTWSGSWATADSGLTWTRTLQIADSDTKGVATFSGLTATNLAGKVQNTIGSGSSYTVGGFVQRTISFAAWPNRESAIGTHVSDTSKLRATNLSKGDNGSLNTSFVSSVGDTVDTFTITQTTGVYNATGNLIYNRDLANAVSNTTGLMQFEVEEIV